MVTRSIWKQSRDDGRRAIFTKDYVSLDILRFGFYEAPFLRALTGIVECNRIQNGVFVDVGAMIGNHSTYLASIFDKVVAIEPNPASFRLLQMNVPPNVEAVNIAVSDFSGELRLDIPPDNPGGASLVDFGRSNSMGDLPLSQRASFSARTARLDELLASLQIRVDDVGLVKIDVEGHEGRVLSGATQLINEGSPLLAIESWAGHGQKPMFDQLRAAGYAYLFEMKLTRPWLVPSSLPRSLSQGARVAESLILGMPELRVRTIPVTEECLPADFQMLLASKSPLISSV